MGRTWASSEGAGLAEWAGEGRGAIEATGPAVDCPYVVSYFIASMAGLTYTFYPNMPKKPDDDKFSQRAFPDWRGMTQRERRLVRSITVAGSSSAPAKASSSEPVPAAKAPAAE